MRALGAVLTFSAFFYAGICVIREKRAKIRDLRELCSALELMQAELAAREPTLQELFRTLSQRGEGRGKLLFSELKTMLPLLGEESFASLWKRDVECVYADQDPIVLDELRGLGNALGRFDTQTQLKAIRSCAACLRQRQEELERAFSDERRLWLGLSAAAGAMVAVMLI